MFVLQKRKEATKKMIAGISGFGFIGPKMAVS